MTRALVLCAIAFAACKTDRKAPAAVPVSKVDTRWAGTTEHLERFVVDEHGARRIGKWADLAGGGIPVMASESLRARFAEIDPPPPEEDDPPPPEPEDEPDAAAGAPDAEQMQRSKEPTPREYAMGPALGYLQGDASRATRGFGGFEYSSTVFGPPPRLPPDARPPDAAVPIPGHHGASGLVDRAPYGALVAAAPATPARVVVEILDEVSGCIGVDAGRGVTCLPISLSGGAGKDAREIDLIVVDLGTTGATVRTSDGGSFGAAGWQDRAALRDAYQAAAAGVTSEWKRAVIVTVDDSVTAQQLVDVIATLLDAGVDAFGLRDWPVPPPRPVIVAATVDGVEEPWDQQTVRDHLRQKLAAYAACPYGAAVDVDVAFRIADKAISDIVVAADEPLRACVEQALRTIDVQWRGHPLVVTKATLRFRLPR